MQVKKLACLFKPVPPLQSEANSSLHGPSKSIYFQLPASRDEAHAATDHVAFPSSLYLSEKEYCSFGLRGEKPNCAISEHASDPYRANRKLEQPRRDPSSLSRFITLVPRGSTPDELFLSGKDCRIYGLRGRNEVPQKSDTVEFRPPLDSYHVETYNFYQDTTVHWLIDICFLCQS